jgi:hypothetical protein
VLASMHFIIYCLVSFMLLSKIALGQIMLESSCLMFES